jgi:hypothetical protein
MVRLITTITRSRPIIIMMMTIMNLATIMILLGRMMVLQVNRNHPMIRREEAIKHAKLLKTTPAF